MGKSEKRIEVILFFSSRGLTFFVVSTHKYEGLQAEIFEIFACVGFLDTKHENSHINFHFIIVKELKHANDLARTIRYRTRIVTLDGDIVNPGGSMTGGGDRKTKSILSQKDELATMRAQLEDYQRQTVEFEQQYQAISKGVNLATGLTLHAYILRGRRREE